MGKLGLMLLFFTFHLMAHAASNIDSSHTRKQFQLEMTKFFFLEKMFLAKFKVRRKSLKNFLCKPS